MSVAKIKMNAKQLAEIVKQKSALFGSWPRNMSVLVYPLDDGWRVLVGYTDVEQPNSRFGSNP